MLLYRKPAQTFAIGWMAVQIILSGCAPAQLKPDQWRDARFDLVWPKAPLPPKIRFLRSLFVSDQASADQGRMAPLLEWMIGKSDLPVPLLNPYGITADGAGRVWVADPGDQTVHYFDAVRNVQEEWRAAGNQPFLSPVGVALDRIGGQVYVADSVLAKVFVLDRQGRMLGSREPPGGFQRPAGMAVGEDGKLYVVDVLRGVIEVFSRQGGHVATIHGAGGELGSLSGPTAVAVDAAGRLYVVDSLHFRVEVIDASGGLVGFIGQLGDVPGTFARPRGVAVDSFGHIFISDAAFDNIQIFDLTGTLLLYWGGSGAAPGKFNLPASLFIDGEDRLYVVDSQNHRVQVFQYLP